MKTFNNDPFKVSCDSWHDMLGDTGDDVVYLDLDVQYTKAEEPSYEISLPFRKLCKYLHEKQPELAAYITKVRTNIGGWGPKETYVVAELVESGIDVRQLAIDMVYATVDLEADRQLWKKRREWIEKNPEQARIQSEKVDKAAADMKAAAENMREGNIKEVQLLERLEEVINHTVMELYPHIAEGDGEHIRKWADRLSRHVRSIGEDVSKISYEARG